MYVFVYVNLNCPTYINQFSTLAYTAATLMVTHKIQKYPVYHKNIYVYMYVCVCMPPSVHRKRIIKKGSSHHPNYALCK